MNKPQLLICQVFCYENFIEFFLDMELCKEINKKEFRHVYLSSEFWDRHQNSGIEKVMDCIREFPAGTPLVLFAVPHARCADMYEYFLKEDVLGGKYTILFYEPGLHCPKYKIDFYSDKILYQPRCLYIDTDKSEV